MSWIKKKDAFDDIINTFTDYYLDEKTLENWSKSGKEINIIKKGNRNGFEDSDIALWKNRIVNSVVILDRDDYLKCFAFAIEAYYHMTRSDFSRGKQRDAGEFLTNQVQGKLGEIAIAKLMLRYNIEIKLDFNVTGEIPSQDIIQIKRLNRRPNVWDNPRLKVSIKSTKMKNVLLAIPENEILLSDRRSDLYILSQVGLFPNHILRIIKTFGADVLNRFNNIIPDFPPIPCRIGGWISLENLTSSGALTGTQINQQYGIEMSSNNYIRITSNLSTDWQLMCNLIIGE